MSRASNTARMSASPPPAEATTDANTVWFCTHELVTTIEELLLHPAVAEKQVYQEALVTQMQRFEDTCREMSYLCKAVATLPMAEHARQYLMRDIEELLPVVMSFMKRFVSQAKGSMMTGYLHIDLRPTGAVIKAVHALYMHCFSIRRDHFLARINKLGPEHSVIMKERCPAEVLHYIEKDE